MLIGPEDRTRVYLAGTWNVPRDPDIKVGLDLTKMQYIFFNSRSDLVHLSQTRRSFCLLIFMQCHVSGHVQRWTAIG